MDIQLLELLDVFNKNFLSNKSLVGNQTHMEASCSSDPHSLAIQEMGQQTRHFKNQHSMHDIGNVNSQCLHSLQLNYKLPPPT